VKIEYAVPCRGIEQLANGTYVLIGVETNGFLATSFPMVLRAMVLLCVTESHVATQAGQASDLTRAVLNPAMEPCGPPLTVQVQAAAHPNLPAGWASRTLAPIGFQFEATMEGAYSIEISVDAASLSVPLLVKAA